VFWLLSFKFAVSFLALGWTLSKIDWHLVLQAFQQMHFSYLICAIFLLGLAIVMTAFRQYFIFHAMHMRINLRKIAVLVFRGTFLNQILPGGVGGDGYRILKMARNSFGKVRVVSAIFWDRVVGFFQIALLCTLAIIVQPIIPALKENIVISLVFVWIAILGTFFAAFIPKSWQIKKLKSLIGLLKFGRYFIKNNGLKTFTVGIISTLSLFAAFHSLSLALNLPFGYLESSIWCAMCVLVTIIPVSLAGWGVREGMLTVVFQNMGIAPEKAVLLGITFGMCQLTIGLLVGLCFFISPNTSKK
jgi:uncharacterized protein (TIRG00374 family)